MKSTLYILPSFLLFTVFTFWMNCAVDPLSPEALRGTWAMLRYTDKETNTTFEVDKPVDIGNGVTRTISGVLLVGEFGVGLQDSEINIIISIRTTIPGEGQQDDQHRFFGRYAIDDSTLTILLPARGEATGETKTFEISRSELRLTLEDDASITTWGKTD